MSKEIEKEIKDLILTKKKASDYIYNDRYIDFCEEIDEKILKLRKSLETKYSKLSEYTHKEYIKTCFKSIDGYLIEDFIKEKNYSVETFKLLLDQIENVYMDNTLVLWASTKPISLLDWLEKFKKMPKSKRNKWEPKFKNRKTQNIDGFILIKSKLNMADIYWYIDQEYDNSHLFIIENNTIKVLNKKEYLMLDELDKIILGVFTKGEFIMVNG